MAELKADGKELLESVTISIRWPRAFGFRMWLTARLIAIAGIVSPVTIEADVIEAEETGTWTDGSNAAGVRHSPDGKMKIDHGAGSIEIS